MFKIDRRKIIGFDDNKTYAEFYRCFSWLVWYKKIRICEWINYNNNAFMLLSVVDNKYIFKIYILKYGRKENIEIVSNSLIEAVDQVKTHIKDLNSLN